MKLDSSVGCFIVLLSILGGLLIAEPVLQATGLLMLLPTSSSDAKSLRGFFSFGSIVFSTVCLFFGFRTILFFIFQAVEFFGKSSLAKPQPMIAITAMICGTACLVGVLWLEYHVASAGSPMPSSWLQAQIVHGQTGNAHFALHDAPATHSSSLVFAQLFAGLVFVTGSALISFGIWSSLPTPSTTSTSRMPPVPPTGDFQVD